MSYQNCFHIFRFGKRISDKYSRSAFIVEDYYTSVHLAQFSIWCVIVWSTSVQKWFFSCKKSYWAWTGPCGLLAEHSRTTTHNPQSRMSSIFLVQPFYWHQTALTGLAAKPDKTHDS